MFWGEFFPSLNGMSVTKDVNIDMFRTYVPGELSPAECNTVANMRGKADIKPRFTILRENADIAAFMETNENPDETVICTSKISHSGTSPFLPELKYLQSITPKEDHHKLKLTMPAPEWYHLRYKEGQAYSKNVYQNDEEYFKDIAKAYQKEISILYENGLRNLQIDDPNLACKSLLSKLFWYIFL